MKNLVYLLLLLSTSIWAEQKIIPLDNRVHQFIKNHCISCHGPDKDKGDRVLHEFPIKTKGGWNIDLSDSNTFHLLEDVLDQLNLGEMPPDKKSIQPPPTEDVRHVISWLTETLTAAHSDDDTSVIRRLNKNEYRNTMNQITGVEPGFFDPTSHFPDDDKVHGFSNISHALNLSDEHLNQYLTAADKYLDMAIHWGSPVKESVIDIKPKDWGAPSSAKRTPWMYRHYTPGKYFDVGCGIHPISALIGTATVPKRFKGITHAGYYTIKINAEAIRRLSHPYDAKMIPTDLSRPMQLGLYLAKGKEGTVAGGTRKRQRIGLYELKDEQRQDFEVTVWLDKGALPFINWENGPGNSDYWMRDILKKYHTDIEFRGKEGAAAWHIVGKDLVPGRTVSDVWQGPLMRIHSFKILGPLKMTYESRFQKQILAGTYDANKLNISAAIEKLMRLAFRIDVSQRETQAFVDIVNKAENQFDMSREDALKMAFKAILVSPQFLFLNQKADEDGDLENSAIANRMSYFFWRRMPDSLLGADEGLKNGEQRRVQAERLLKNKAGVTQMISDFMESWLRYDQFGVMAPDPVKFGEFYRWGLKDPMSSETFHFIMNALEKNRPITDFLDSDYTFLNSDLARHYQIKGVKGIHFRKVKLAKNSVRGGLLGHAGIQSLSSNGVETSPIIRGIWVLENILGMPPPPPPPDVEPLDADTRGATTLKERLEKHRKVEACADCHSKIDPYGFALENFNPIGNYRTHYAKKMRWDKKSVRTKKSGGPKVDPTSVLHTGKKLQDLNDLKKELFKRRDQFALALTEKLMTFAKGREMTFRDHLELKRISSLHPPEKYGFRDLITEIVSSDLFIAR
ncbi:hypothetical protein LNTAR_11916 [Lentisphaera araneosa HTCC2155]|uniref:Cytochrome c domain-containing protein n=1 Tax=Lentisphaera araneosa HTCC2155 TaxID=313628 RepID=A6DJI4_9BACT|nr:DUF1588 domain-containing protein [Lentisphaera araneosa]EDM28058.1 hypothetical protein LNTAR_11916 [Lentisphaera araneosa HTCC2155]